MKMKVLVFISIFFLVGFVNSSFAQNIILKHRHEKKVKILSFSDPLIFITHDSTYSNHHLVAIEDDNLMLANWSDTLSIPLSNLIMIKKYNFKKRGIIEPFVYIGLLSVAGMIIFPIADLIESGGDDALEVMGITAATAAISGGVIMTALSKRKFNLKKDWKIYSQP